LFPWKKTVDDTVQGSRERGIDLLDAMYGLSFSGPEMDETVSAPDRGRQNTEHDAR
jgi:hypothetical protein